MKLATIENRKSKIENNRGTAFMAVIIMMVLIAAAIAAMGSLFAAEAKRTKNTIAGAQLRQLLLAADPAAREELARNATPHELSLPTPIGSLKLHIESASSTTATIRTTARLPDAVMVSTTTYTRIENGEGWTLQSATLSGM
jgi:hypothetical protein